MTIDVLAAGVLVPKAPWKGRLLSVHDAAVSFLHPEGLALTALADPGRMEGFALLLPGEGFASLRAACLAAKEHAGGDSDGAGRARPAAELRDGLLLASGLALDQAGAAPWDPRPRLAKAAAALVSADARSLQGALEALLAEYRGRRPAAGIHEAGSALSRFFFDRLEGGGLSGVVGLGPGTTPAGDDFAAGACLAAACRGRPPRLDGTPPDGRTTPQGRSLLVQAAAGVFPEQYAGLAEALADFAASRPGGAGGGSAARAALSAAVGALLAHGATSGADALAGFLYGWDLPVP